MSESVNRSIRGIRAAIPYAHKFAAAYSRDWDAVPWVTRVLVYYGLFLREYLVLTVVLAVAVFAGFQGLVHHKKLSKPILDAFPAVHLSGVLMAILVICAFLLPTVLSRTPAQPPAPVPQTELPVVSPEGEEGTVRLLGTATAEDGAPAGPGESPAEAPSPVSE
jgi:hypothetical protein